MEGGIVSRGRECGRKERKRFAETNLVMTVLSGRKEGDERRKKG
jgi:hypothetical protein